MPQLDLMHFFSQFFWFSIVFTILFFYINFNILPLLVKILKYRSKKLNLLSKRINDSKKNMIKLYFLYDNIIFNSFKTTNQESLTLLTRNKEAEKLLLEFFSNDFFYVSNKYYFISLQLNIYKEFIFNKKIKNEV